MNGGNVMRKDIVSHYSNHVLLPIETFIKQEETVLGKLGNAATKEQIQILEKASDLFLEKLTTFCTLCDEAYQLEEKLKTDQKKNY